MKSISTFAAVLSAAVFAAPVLAQMSHVHGAMPVAAATAPSQASGQGQVRKIDLGQRKVTLKHEASQELGMPAMTMVYPVSDAAVLAKVKVGDMVRFRATTTAGRTTITELQAVH